MQMLALLDQDPDQAGVYDIVPGVLSELTGLFHVKHVVKTN
jgi:hypothetical protein